MMPEESKYHHKDDGAWLSTGLPDLHGKHPNRPWIQVLLALTHGEVGD